MRSKMEETRAGNNRQQTCASNNRGHGAFWSQYMYLLYIHTFRGEGFGPPPPPHTSPSPLPAIVLSPLPDRLLGDGLLGAGNQSPFPGHQLLGVLLLGIPILFLPPCLRSRWQQS